MTTTTNSVLSDDLLKRCMERAPGYDRDNKFFDEDFKELKEAGYLLAAVPKEFGGLGLNPGTGHAGAAPPGLPCRSDSPSG